MSDFLLTWSALPNHWRRVELAPTATAFRSLVHDWCVALAESRFDTLMIMVGDDGESALGFFANWADGDIETTGDLELEPHEVACFSAWIVGEPPGWDQETLVARLHDEFAALSPELAASLVGRAVYWDEPNEMEWQSTVVRRLWGEPRPYEG